jgi:PAS domain S-box-containing protein
VPYFSIFVLAVLIGSWYGGWGAGLLSTALAILSAAYLIAEPVGSLAITSREDLIRMASFLAVALLVCGFCAAVRGRASAREALLAAQLSYRELFRRSPQPMWVYDRETLRFLDVNDSAVAHYGYSFDEFLRMTIEDIRPAEEVGRLRDLLARSSGETLRRMGIWKHRKKDGSLIDVEISSHAINWADRPARLVLASDVTKRLRADGALRKSEETYRQAIENAAGVPFRLIFGAEPGAGHYDFVGAGIEDLLGVAPADFTERRFQEMVLEVVPLLPGMPTDPVQCRHAMLRGALPTYKADVRVRTAQGVERWVNDTSVPIRDETSGRVIGALGILADVTERRKLEEQLRQALKMEAVGRLAGGVAHDFNNLLMVINGYAELLRERLAADTATSKSLDEILKASQRAATLIRQLLAFSRKQVLAPKILSLNEVVRDVEKMLRRVIGEDIELVTQFTEGLGSVQADPGQVEQVLLNLAVNARDAMPSGGQLVMQTSNVEVDESFARRHLGLHPGSWISISLSDTGGGMDPETLAHIFEPFFTTKEKGKGTGLGLATVYGIVKQSGGYIHVESEMGKGTTFVIYFPRVASVPESQAAREPSLVPAGGHETILVVEDEEGVREVTVESLSAKGYTVLAARHAEEALRLARDHAGPLHLLLTDLILPGTPGRHLAEQLSALRPGLRVLYMSGYSSEASLSPSAPSSGSGFLPKPFSPAMLARRVREILDA